MKLGRCSDVRDLVAMAARDLAPYKSDPRNHVDRLREAVSLSIVCRRFHRLVAPYLYRDLEFAPMPVPDADAIPPGTTPSPQSEVWLPGGHFETISQRATKHLHRTLVENPSLRKHCKTLKISVDGSPAHRFPTYPDQWPILVDLLATLTETKKLTINAVDCRADDSRDLLLLFTAAGDHMASLEEVCMDCQFAGKYPDVPTMILLLLVGMVPQAKTVRFSTSFRGADVMEIPAAVSSAMVGPCPCHTLSSSRALRSITKY